MNIYLKLAEIQQTLKVPKGRKNNHSGYMYRNCDDILEAFKKNANGSVIFLNDSIEMIGDRHYVKATAVFAHPECETQITVAAYAREVEAKFSKGGTESTDRAQITGAASSYARKYALNGLLALDDSEDPDDESYGGSSHQSRPAASNGGKQVPVASNGAKQAQQPTTPKVISDAQMSRLMAIANEFKVTQEQQIQIVKEQFGFDSRKLITTDKYDAVVKAYQSINQQ